MTVCTHCEEGRISRCSYADCPFEVEQANETIARLQEQLEAVTRERSVSTNDPHEIEEANIRADLAIDRMHAAEARAARLEAALREADKLASWAAQFVEDKTYPSDNWYAEWELYRDYTREAALDVNEAG